SLRRCRAAGDNFLWLGFSTRRGASRARPRSLSLPPCWRGSRTWGTRRLSAGINGRNLLSLSLMRRSGEASIRSRVPAPWDRGLLLERWWARSFVTPRGFTHLKVNLKNFIPRNRADAASHSAIPPADRATFITLMH